MSVESGCFELYRGYNLKKLEDPHDGFVLEGVDIPGMQFLTNRTFEQVDKILGFCVSKEIEQRIKNGQTPVRVLDVAGGTRASAARGIAWKYGSNVEVTSLDVIKTNTKSEDSLLINRVLASAVDMPISSNSKDIIYSSFALILLEDYTQNQIVEEMIRVLKPGGEIIIQDIFSRKNGIQIDVDSFPGIVSRVEEVTETKDKYFKDVMILEKPPLDTLH